MKRVPGLERLAYNKDRSFIIIVGLEERECNCSREQAIFISKKVFELLQSDPATSSFHIIRNKNAADFVDLLNSLLRGEAIDSIHADNLLILAHELGYEDLSRHVIAKQCRDELSTGNCVSRILLKSKHNINFECEITFLALHLSEFNCSKIADLSPEQFEEVLSHEHMRHNIIDQNMLFKLISDLSNKNEAYFRLLNYVNFEYLSSTNLPIFFDKISGHENENTIRKMAKQMIHCHQRGVLTFDPEKEIFAQLRKKCNGMNPHPELVYISASSDYGNPVHVKPHRVLDDGRGPTQTWASANTPNQYWQCDFKTKRLRLAGYMLVSAPPGWCQLREWEVRGTNDDKMDWNDWDILDSRPDGNLLEFKPRHFACQLSHNSYRYIGIKSTGKGADGRHFTQIHTLGFWGELTE